MERDPETQAIVDANVQATAERCRMRERIAERHGARAALAFDQEVQYRAGSGAARTWAYHRAVAAQAASDCLLAGDTDGARPHLHEALRKHQAVTLATKARDRYPMQAPIEEAARKFGMDPTAARAAWVRHPELADLFIEVGRIMEQRSKNAGRRREPEAMLADLWLAAEAERQERSAHRLASHMLDRKASNPDADARKLAERARAARKEIEAWIAAA